MYCKVLEHARGSTGVLFCHDGEFAAARGSADPRAAEGGRKRLERLRFVEERLRPLRETPMARVYWRVVDELGRLENQMATESDRGGRREQP